MVSAWLYILLYMFGFISEWLSGLLFKCGGGSSGCDHYSGYYLDGRASYYYYTDSNDKRVYEGLFRYTKKEYDFSNGKTVYKVSGCFSKNSRNGRWVFSKKSSHGKRTLCIDYENGVQNGRYIYKSVEKHHGIGQDAEPAYISLFMCNGKPVGKVYGRFGKCVLMAEFDSDGLPDGRWTMDMSASAACRKDYEMWSHGTLADAYSVDVSTGDRLGLSEHINSYVRAFIYRYCTPLEGLLKKGTTVWRCGAEPD